MKLLKELLNSNLLPLFIVGLVTIAGSLAVGERNSEVQNERINALVAAHNIDDAKIEKMAEEQAAEKAYREEVLDQLNHIEDKIDRINY